MERYFIRASKRFIYTTILFLLIYGVMLLTNTTSITVDHFATFLKTKEALVMVAAFIILALVHPFLGFVKKDIAFDPEKDHDKAVDAFNSIGFILSYEDENQMVFESASKLKRFLLLYEDKITIYKKPFPYKIEGNRKYILKVIYKIEM